MILCLIILVHYKFYPSVYSIPWIYLVSNVEKLIMFDQLLKLIKIIFECNNELNSYCMSWFIFDIPIDDKFRPLNLYQILIHSNFTTAYCYSTLQVMQTTLFYCEKRNNEFFVKFQHLCISFQCLHSFLFIVIVNC